MKEAIRAALATPLIVTIPVVVISGIITIIIVVILGFRSMRMDDIRGDLKQISANQAAIEKHLEYIDQQNASSIRDRKALHEQTKDLGKKVQSIQEETDR